MITVLSCNVVRRVSDDEEEPSPTLTGSIPDSHSERETTECPVGSAALSGHSGAIGCCGRLASQCSRLTSRHSKPKEDLPASPDTNVVEFEVNGNAVSGVSSLAIVNGRLTFERVDSVYYELAASIHGSYGASNGVRLTPRTGVPGSVSTRLREGLSHFFHLWTLNRTQSASSRYERGWGPVRSGRFMRKIRHRQDVFQHGDVGGL